MFHKLVNSFGSLPRKNRTKDLALELKKSRPSFLHRLVSELGEEVRRGKEGKREERKIKRENEEKNVCTLR